MKKRTLFVTIVSMLLSVCLFAACGGEKPFSRRFTGIVGCFGAAEELTAVLQLSDSDQAFGEIAVKAPEERNYTFRYAISENGDITFTFDGEGEASGTLHGKEIDVTAKVGGKEYLFAGTFYLLTEKIDGEIAEEGYVVSGHPFSDVITPPEETERLTVNGTPMTTDEFSASVMPPRDTLVEITTASE